MTSPPKLRNRALLNAAAAIVTLVFRAGGTRGDDPQPNGEFAVNVMTFNIRYGTASDGPNAWPLPKMAALLETLLELDRVTKRHRFLELDA